MQIYELGHICNKITYAQTTLAFFEQIVLVKAKIGLIECAKIRLFCSKVHFNYKLLV